MWDSSFLCVYRNPLTEESSKLLLEDSLLTGLKLPWNYTTVLDSFSPVLYPSFFPSGNSSNREHWQKLGELEERKDKGLSPLYFCFLWYLQQDLCLLHGSISLHIIYLFLLWPSPLLAAPTEPLTPSMCFLERSHPAEPTLKEGHMLHLLEGRMLLHKLFEILLH